MEKKSTVLEVNCFGLVEKINRLMNNGKFVIFNARKYVLWYQDVKKTTDIFGQVIRDWMRRIS